MNDTAKLILGIFGGFFALLLLLVLAGGSMFGMGPMMFGSGNGPGGMMGGFGSWWVLVPILFWGGLLALVGWAVARMLPKSGSRNSEPDRDNAEEVLRERFARGEVEAEEYERSLQVLRGSARRSKQTAPGADHSKTP